MRRRQWFWFVVTAVVLWAVPPASASNWDHIFRLCLDILESPVPVPTTPSPIPIGCRIIDCCPGCPASGPLEWRVRLTGDLAQSVVLEFENLPPLADRRIGVAGNAKLLESNKIQINRGQTILSGFTADPRAQAPVAIPRLILDQAIVKKLQEVANMDVLAAPKDAAQVEFVVEQMLGQVVVNEFKVLYRFRTCTKPTGATDQIVISNNPGTDNAVVLVDGRRSSGCANDEIWPGTGNINVGNVLSNGSCNSEAIVFSKDRAMQLHTSVTAWTDDPIDRLPVDLSPNLLQIPVIIYIMQEPFADTKKRAEGDMERARDLFNKMKCGIGFWPVTILDKTAEAKAAGLLNADCPLVGRSDVPGSLMAEIGYTVNSLNAYYLLDPDGARGWNCRPSDPDVVLVSSKADLETLSHEFGHAFSLWHSNGISNIANTNLMISGGTGRDNITKGQCFRCNVNNDSFVNKNIRLSSPVPGAVVTRGCPDNTTSDICLALALDAP